MEKPYRQSGAYIPRADAAFRDWAENFSRLISQDPNRFGLCKSDAAVIANHTKQFVEAYVAVQSAEKRTPSLIKHKDAIRASAEASFRVYAGNIRGNMGVPNDDRQALGLHVADTTRTPIGKPETAPVVNIIAAFSGSHVLRYRDETTHARRKPHGTIGIEIFMAVGETITNNPNDARYVGTYSRQPIHIHHDPADSAKTASYFGRWITKRGLVGPWSLPVWMVIAFGGGMSGEDSSSAGGTLRAMAMNIAA